MTLNEILNQAGRSLEDIKEIYHGRDHACRCGCCGNYFDRGSRGFTRAINQMNKPEFKNYEVNAPEGKNYINISYDDYNDKCYCVYFN